MIRLAPTDIVLRHADLAVTLRPSLRAGYRLNEKHGVGKLANGVAEGNLTIIYDVLYEGGGDRAVAIVERKLGAGLGKALDDLADPLTTFLAACYGVDQKNHVEHPAEARAKTGKPFDLETTLIQFFEIGTGWLGWTPEATWAATPAEIIAAQRGLVAKLKAIHGAADDKTEPTAPDEVVTLEQAREGIARLRALSGQAS